MAILSDVLPQALMIAGFVFVMMVVVEYLNVLTRGGWEAILSRWTWGQSIVCAALGAIPGCLGAFAVASFYMHRIVAIGGAVAAMIATCGDEAFVMLALFPERAIGLLAILFVLGFLVGLGTDLLLKRRKTTTTYRDAHASAHPDQISCVPFSSREILQQWRHCSPHRGWLVLLLALFLTGVVTGRLGHEHLDVHGVHPSDGAAVHMPDHDEHEEVEHTEHTHHGWGWVRITLLVTGLIGLAIVITVPDHFLDEHLWNHIARVHIWRILLWTVGALILTHVLIDRINMDAIVHTHRLPVLLLACLIGLIPESGPHLVFVTLYADGTIPFSTLLASCIVQDGHGMLPVLAHSRRAYVGIKAINFAVGLAAGLLGHAMGW